jgi:hypothetical protein
LLELLDELELLEEFASEAALALPFSSSGNGNAAAVLAAGVALGAELEAVPVAAPAVLCTDGRLLELAGAAYGFRDVPLPLVSSGKGNFSVALVFPEVADGVPHGSGCGSTEHGAGAGFSVDVLCAPHTPAVAITPATSIAPSRLRIASPLLHFRRSVRLLPDDLKPKTMQAGVIAHLCRLDVDWIAVATGRAWNRFAWAESIRENR